MGDRWKASHLWRETLETKETLLATIASLPPDVAALADLLGARGVRRIVATGNGAAYYAALALWLASLESASGPEVVTVPAGLVARGAFRWRDGDRMLAFSSSGEMRDVIEALDAGAPEPFAAITATPGSSIGSRAGARARVTVASQEAVTHTQAFCGNVAAALSVWAVLGDDPGLATAVREVPEAFAAACGAAEAWADALPGDVPATGVVFGTGPAWAGALEGALLLKEVAGIPAEGVETREGATSAMYPLAPGHLVVSLASADDPLGAEAEGACAARGATVIRAPGVELADPRLAAITTFPALVALAGRLGSERGLDVDRPAWTDAYYAVARGAA
jgi:fructoselysine-6-P-deglycase FrlB-like protein